MRLTTLAVSAAVAIAPLTMGVAAAHAAPSTTRTWQRVHTWEQCLTRLKTTHGVCVRTDKDKVYLGRSSVAERDGTGCVDQPKSAAGSKAVEVADGYTKSKATIGSGTCASHTAAPTGNTAAPGKDVILPTPVDWNWSME